jgi:hypothetical protein
MIGSVSNEESRRSVSSRNGSTVNVTNDEMQGWPDVQFVPCGCFGCTKKLQIQATW